MRTDIIIRATKTQNVLGVEGRRIRELTSVVQKKCVCYSHTQLPSPLPLAPTHSHTQPLHNHSRFGFAPKKVELYAEKVPNRGLCAQAQAESLRYKLLGGLAVRRACYGVLRFVMEAGAKGCEVVVSGKLRAQRAKVMKFKEGYMIKTGEAADDYVDSAVRHVMMRQGVLGVKVSIMLPHDPTVRGFSGVLVLQFVVVGR